MKVLLKSNTISFPKASCVEDGEYYIIKSCIGTPGLEFYTEDVFEQICNYLKILRVATDDPMVTICVRTVMSSCQLVKIANKKISIPSNLSDFLGRDGDYNVFVHKEYIKVTRDEKDDDYDKSVLGTIIRECKKL